MSTTMTAGTAVDAGWDPGDTRSHALVHARIMLRRSLRHMQRYPSLTLMVTLMPLLSGLNYAHHGKILRHAAELADAGKLKPLINKQQFSLAELDAAFTLVSSGALGKVVVELL